MLTVSKSLGHVIGKGAPSEQSGCVSTVRHTCDYRSGHDADARTHRIGDEITHSGVAAGNPILRNLYERREANEADGLVQMVEAVPEPERDTGREENSNVFDPAASVGHRPQ
jgi:hypothetical protein